VRLNDRVDGSADDLRELATAYGVATEYWDSRGRHVAMNGETLTDVLTALGADTSTPDRRHGIPDRSRTLSQRYRARRGARGQLSSGSYIWRRGIPSWYPVSGFVMRVKLKTTWLAASLSLGVGSGSS
jgi:hypothetical protein